MLTATASPLIERPQTLGELPRAVTNPRDGATLLLVPGGHYCAGEGEREQVVHFADYYLAQRPVTETAYQRFCVATGHSRPPYYGSAFAQPDAPVVGVAWEDARAYATWAGLRLPTEWEWEKAAVLGTVPDLPLSQVAWFRENSGGHPHRVGVLAANALGFHDLLGNTWEWTEDYYDAQRLYHVVRGGSWKTVAEDVRATHRDFNPPVDRMRCVGFRCARSIATVRGQ